MALVIKDRVQETTTTTSTGSYSLAGAKAGFQSFSVIGDGNTCYYACTDGTDFEIGVGTYTSSNSTLARTTILESSNSDAAVNWGSGSKDIFVTYPADKAVFKDASGNIAITGDVTIEDNEKLYFGDGQDLSIHHYSDNWIVSNNGDLHIRQEAVDKDVKIQADNANGHAVDYFQADGSTGEVILSHFGYPKIKTKSTGADITGNITVSGTVDGVDISARDAVLTSTTTTANAAMPTSGGTFTGDVAINGNADLNGTLDLDASPSGYLATFTQGIASATSHGISVSIPATAAHDANILRLNGDGEDKFVVKSSGNVEAKGTLEADQLTDANGKFQTNSGGITVTGNIGLNRTSSSTGILGFNVLNGTWYDVDLVPPSTPTANRTITLPDQSGTAMLWQSAWPDDPTGGDSIAIGDSALSNANSSAVFSTAIGHNAGAAITSGERNTIIGGGAGDSLTTGGFCTAVGQSAMPHNTTDWYTTVVGAQAGYGDFLTGGTYVGAYAGNYNSTSKDFQVAIGYQASNDNSGDNSVAVGAYAMSDGHHVGSVAVGHNALGRYNSYYPYYNTAVGNNAGDNIYSGDYLVFIGNNSDTWSASGYQQSVAVGHQAMINGSYSVSVGANAQGSPNGTSHYCTVVGNQAGYDMDGGDDCTFIGSSAGYSGGTGSYNSAVGSQSLRNLTSGGYNSALGNLCLYRVETGEYNSSLGNKAGYNVTTGSNNTFVGHNAGYIQDNYATTALDTGSNVTCLGYEAVPSSTTATNEITLGDNDITSLRCNVQTISSLSDERDKTAIADLTYGLDFINDMRPVEFTWNRRDGSLGAKPDIGFIAQELYDTELDHSSTSRTRLVNWENPEKLEADYVRSYPILVKAVQELSAQVTALQARIETLEGN